MSMPGKTDGERPDENRSNTLQDALITEMTRLTADIRRRLLSELQEIEQDYSPILRDLYSRVVDEVRADLEVSVQKESEARLQESLSKLREQFMRKIERAGVELEVERRRIRDGGGTPLERDKAVIEELRKKESELDTMDMELAAMIDNPEVEISKVIRHNALHSELKAYVRGLKFQRGEPAKSEEIF